MPLVVDAPNRPLIAEVLIVCRHHCDEVLATWELYETERNATLYAPPRPDGTETIGFESLADPTWNLTPDIIERQQHLGITAPVAFDQPGHSHSRFIYRCPRPSCSYSPKVETRQHQEIVLGLLRTGVRKIIATDIDQPRWDITVATP